MGTEFDPLRLRVLRDGADEHDAEQRAESRAALEEDFAGWLPTELHFATGSLLQERYGDRRGEAAVDPAVKRILAENWKRVLSHIDGGFDLKVPKSDTRRFFIDLSLRDTYGWGVEEYVSRREHDVVRINAPVQRVTVEYEQQFMPKGLQANQMSFQVRRESVLTDRPDTGYDTYGRHKPYPRLLYSTFDDIEILSSINQNHPLVVEGLDYDAVEKPEDLGQAREVLRHGCERVRRRLVDPHLSTFAGIALRYALDGKEDAGTDMVYIPNPDLPVACEASKKFTLSLLGVTKDIQPRRGVRRLARGAVRQYETFLAAYAEGQDSDEAHRYVQEYIRPAAEEYLFPVVGTWLRKETERGAYLLDLIEG